MAVAYPTNLSIPVVAGYSQSDAIKTEVIEVESGLPRFELMTENGYADFKVGWILSQLEFQVFEGWFKYELDYGKLSFDMNLKVGGGLKSHELRFLGDYQASLIGKKWRVTANLISLVKQYDDLATFQAAKAILCPPLFLVGDLYWALNDGASERPIYSPSGGDSWLLTTARTYVIGDVITFKYRAVNSPDIDGVLLTSNDGSAFFGFGDRSASSFVSMAGFTAKVNGVAVVNGSPLPSNYTSPTPPTLPSIEEGRHLLHTVELTALTNSDVKRLGVDFVPTATKEANQAIGELTVTTGGQAYFWAMDNTASSAQPESNVGGNDIIIQSYSNTRWSYQDVFHETNLGDERNHLQDLNFLSQVKVNDGINQASLRADGAGGSADLNVLLVGHQPSANDRLIKINYVNGFTVEVTVQFKNKPVYNSTGGMTAVIGTSDNINIPIFEMRWDNWAAATPTTDEFRPCFTILNRGALYNNHSRFATQVTADIRGTVEPVIGQIYHMLGTLRPSDNSMEFWLDGVSIGTAVIPAAWWDNGDPLNWGLINPTDNFAGSHTKLILGESIGSQTKAQMQDLRIHLLEADQEFATQQYEYARVTT